MDSPPTDLLNIPFKGYTIRVVKRVSLCQSSSGREEVVKNGPEQLVQSLIAGADALLRVDDLDNALLLLNASYHRTSLQLFNHFPPLTILQ
ncbi:hypothetical protein NPIL_116321 [Nephila pilipes]|uniref:Uncharacterized protein n=1 Tax=Nephila pilipes TaxID=299642 RepID=A0A8X6Q0L0_NEPPI|nr:hypothetical protein NPIL_116321 [Nephila pilipes]